MSIIYVVSILFLFISFLYLKKSENKLDVVVWIVINTVLLLAYNTFICYLLSMINISINLLTLSIINYVLSILFVLIISKKGMQNYSFDKNDLIVIGIMLLFTIVIVMVRFGIPLNIDYIATDSGAHYHAANQFYQSDKLNEGTMMPGAYSNAGILMKVFAPFVEFVDLYNVYICFDIFMFFIAGILMYVALKKMFKSKYDILISATIALLYIIAYPLNILIVGHFYLQLGVIVFSTIIIVMEFFKEEVINRKFILLMISLLCFELFFSYYLFAPAVYIAIFIYYVYFFYKKHNRIINKEVLIYTFVTLVLPGIMGVIYHILPSVISSVSSSNVSSSGNALVNLVAMEGYIYRNKITNILLFIPFVILYFIKKKEINYNVVLFVTLAIYMFTMYIGCQLNVVSTYYFYKLYFVLWFLILYLSGIAIMDLVRSGKKGEIIGIAFAGIYFFLLIISLNIHTVNMNKEYDTKETILDVMDIYGANRTLLNTKSQEINTQEIEVLEYIQKEIEITKNTDFMLLIDPVQEFWFWGIFNYKNRENPETRIENEEIKKWNNGKKYEYLIYFNKSARFLLYKDKFDLNKKVIFSNESGGILKNE